MSGSERSSGIGLGPGIGGRDCTSVTAERPLLSPNAGALAGAASTDDLAVVYSPGPPEVVQIRTKAGIVLGSIVPTTELLDCLKRGVPFVGRLSTLTGLTRVKIRAL